MPASTAPAAKAALKALFAARPGLSTVSVMWEVPTREEQVRNEMLFFGNVTVDGSWQVMGGLRRDEEYSVALTLQVRREGDDPQATEERAWTLLDEVAAAIASDKYLGGLLHQAAALTSISQENVATPEDWWAVITAQIACAARFST